MLRIFFFLLATLDTRLGNGRSTFECSSFCFFQRGGVLLEVSGVGVSIGSNLNLGKYVGLRKG